jgi:RNA polymerase sigma factor (sigma-70 family)
MGAANTGVPVLLSAHDVELAALSAGGDRRAFGELVRRHGSAVRGLLRRMGADPAQADDVAQDAFLIAFEQIADFRGEGTFQAWTKRIAARTYVRRWRRETRERLLADASEAEAAAGGEDGVAGRLDLDGALAALPPAERVCVSLCYGAGLSHAEAAAALKLPLGTVKSHVRRGLDRLKRRLAPPQGDGPGDGASGRRGHD